MGKKGEHTASASASENIKVLVRCRPLNEKELDNGYKSCVDLNISDGTVQVNHLCGNPDRWTFDAVINNTYSQKDIFTQNIQPLVDSVLDGFNATVFAYGQSGSGKTHTMTGKYDDDELKGIIPRCFDHVFNTIRTNQQTNPNRRYTMYCSFVELYLGKVRDLLAKQQVTLAVKENKDKTFYVQGAHIPQVKFPEDLFRLMEEGTDRRRVGVTELNSDSSRSHSLFTLILECTETAEDGDIRSVTSKLNLVDLAGSERQSKTGATGDTLKEGCNINLSLSALGTVIDTIVKAAGHIPFRSSPLTMLLKDSLGGSSKTVMFANIGPSEHNLSETVSTLRFADRAKQIKNKPVINMDTKDQKIAELTEQVAELKNKLKMYESGGMKDLEKEVQDLTEKYGDLEIDRDNAVKGREADAMDFDQVRSTLQAQLDEATGSKDDLQDQLTRLQQELRIAEQEVQDEQKQRMEIFAVCSSQFGMEMEGVDDLISHLRKLSHNTISVDEHTKLQAEFNELQAQLGNDKEHYENQVTQAQAASEHLEDELAKMTKKIEKLKANLDKEKQARKQLVVEHSSSEISPARSNSMYQMQRRSSMNAMTPQQSVGGANEEEGSTWLVQKQEIILKYESVVSSLQESVSQLETDLHENVKVKELEKELKRMSEEKSATITSLMEELKETTAIVSQPSDNDSVAVQHLKKLLKVQEDAMTNSRKEIDTLEAQLESQRELQKKQRHQERKGGKSENLGGDGKGKATAEGQEDLSVLRHEQEEILDEYHMQQRQKLRTQLTTTSEHRDELLMKIIEGKGADDLARDIQRLTAENSELRKQTQTETVNEEKWHQLRKAEKRWKKRTADIEEKFKELQARSNKETVSVGRTKELQHQVNTLQDTIRTMRDEFSVKEEKLLKVTKKLSNNNKAKENGSSGVSMGEEEEENPLETLVAMLRDDKAILNDSVNQLTKELRALESEYENVQTTLLQNQVDAQELERMQVMMTAPVDGDSEQLVSLKSELAKRDEMITKLKKQAAAGVSALQISQLNQNSSGNGEISPKTPRGSDDEFRKVEAELRSKSSVFEMEKNEMTAELDNLKSDLQEEIERRTKAETDHQKAVQDVATIKDELGQTKMQLVQMENKLNEQKSEMVRIISDSQDHTSLIETLEARVTERTTQLKSLRETLENQKTMMTKMKSKVEAQQLQINSLKQDLIVKDQEKQKALQEQEQHIHVMMNKKIEAINEEHQKALQRKDEDNYTLKKKIKKLEDKVEKAKTKYDEKVWEFEELKGRMEEQKVEAMQMMKEVNVVQIETGKERIVDTLQTAKEEQKRKKDLFEAGEVTSALANIRVAGNAALAVKKAQAQLKSPLNPPNTPPQTSFDRTGNSAYDF